MYPLRTKDRGGEGDMIDYLGLAVRELQAETVDF